MAALVENDMTTNGKTILKHIKDNNVTQAGRERVFSVSGAPAVLGSACFGLHRTDKTIVEVLYIKLVQR